MAKQTKISTKSKPKTITVPVNPQNNKLGAVKKTQVWKEAPKVLHITAGIPGEWDPSWEELEAIAELFSAAVDGPQGGVVVTRVGVEVHVLPMK